MGNADRFLTALCVGLLVCAPAVAQDWAREWVAEDGSAALAMEQSGPRVDVFYRTIFPSSDIVATVTFRAQDAWVNATAGVLLPYTTTVRGTERVRVFALTLADPSRRWDAPITYRWNTGSAGARWQAGPARLPYAPHEAYRILQGHDGALTHKGEFRYALDWDMPQGTPVRAIRDGVVVAVEERYTTGSLSLDYWGKDNHVNVLHADGTVARYVHMVKDGVAVSLGQMVRAGQVIAYSGNTGYSDSPHLHLDVASAVDGETRQTIPVAFVTGCAPEGEIPVQGVIYGEGRCGVLDTQGIVVAPAVKDNRPQGAGTVFAPGGELLVFIPIDRPGAYRLGVRVVSEDGRVLTAGQWSTERDWWYTYWTFPATIGVWKAEVTREGSLEATLSFRVAETP